MSHLTRSHTAIIVAQFQGYFLGKRKIFKGYETEVHCEAWNSILDFLLGSLGQKKILDIKLLHRNYKAMKAVL